MHDRFASGRFAEDRHVVGVAAELGNVVAYPLECSDLIERAVVSSHSIRGLSAQFGVGKVTHEAEPVVNGDRYNTERSQHVGGVVRVGAGAILVVAAMDPHHDRHGRTGTELW